MKRVFMGFVLMVFALVIIVCTLKYFRQKIDSALSVQPIASSAPTPTPAPPAANKIDEATFVPYWTVTKGFVAPPYQRLIYFGISATASGLDQSDEGFKRLPLFIQAAGKGNKLLAIRMLDNTTNFMILKDKKIQDKVILQSIDIAREHGFKGVILDLEVSALPFTSLIDQITYFNSSFAKSAHASDLSYGITAYGDTFYRLRPFDIQKIAAKSDQIYIMAYDFSKAKGNPGPNFPLSGNSIYGYDYEYMINNFADVVPLKKITVIFGMYGYDWPVDDDDKAIDTAQAISLKDIKTTVVDTCKHLKCEWERDLLSAETRATYEDGSDEKHIIWFEDEESVKRKQSFLKKHGIGSFAYWAYSYF